MIFKILRELPSALLLPFATVGLGWDRWSSVRAKSGRRAA